MQRSKKLIFIFGVMALTFGGIAAADEVNWSKDYWAWGQGSSTNEASVNARENSKVEADKLRRSCNDAGGNLTTSTEWGYCTSEKDPMFCPNGCWSCPIFGTATCTEAVLVGDLVEAIRNANMYLNSRIVGSIMQGSQFEITQLDGEWAKLKDDDGTVHKGWAHLRHLKKIHE